MLYNFFTNVGIKLAKDITVSSDHNFKDYLHSKPSISLGFKSVSELEINNIIDKLDTMKSYGFDGISNVSSQLKTFFETPYCYNRSDATKWKISKPIEIAKIFPTYKKEDKNI